MLPGLVLSAKRACPGVAAVPPLGILTRAYDAQLGSAEAYSGLSVFEGDSLSMSEEGKLGARIGTATLAFSQGGQASLQHIEKGTHVDMSAGALFFAAPDNVFVELHIADATFRPASNQVTHAEVRSLGAGRRVQRSREFGCSRDD